MLADGELYLPGVTLFLGILVGPETCFNQNRAEVTDAGSVLGLSLQKAKKHLPLCSVKVAVRRSPSGSEQRLSDSSPA